MTNTEDKSTTITTTPMIVKTSKEWVLPPRPKPGRKPVKEMSSANKSKIKPRKKYQKKANIPTTSDTPDTTTATTTTSTTQLSDLHQDINDVTCIMKNIKTIDSENLSLKSTLLSLIHDYKHLKNLVLNPEVITSLHQPLDSNVHKRSYTEVKTTNEITTTTSEFDKFINMDVDTEDLHKKSKKLTSPSDFFDPIDSDMEIDFEDEYEYNILMTSPTLSTSELSRTTSPYSSDFESNSLMSTLTRSTTVSSTMSFDKPKFTNKFFELPKYEEEQEEFEYSFKFDELMNNSKNDQYNMITDFLEEKLITNDIEYYTTVPAANTTSSDNDLIW